MKRKLYVSAALFFLPVIGSVPLFVSDRSLAEITDVGTIEFEVGERRGISGKKQPRLFVTKSASLDLQLMRIVKGFIIFLSSAVKNSGNGEEIHGLICTVLSNYWRNPEIQPPGKSIRPNFVATLYQELSGGRLSGIVNAVLYASGGNSEFRSPGLARGIELAIEKRFQEFVESGRLKEIEESKTPFFILTLLLSRFRDGEDVGGSDDASEKLLFFGNFEEIEWVDGRPDKVKVRVSVLPSSVNSLELLMKIRGLFDEGTDGLLLDVLRSATSLFFDSSKARQIMKPVIAAPMERKPELAQLAVAASVIGAIKIFSRPSEGIAKKVADLLAGVDTKSVRRFRGLWNVDSLASEEERISQIEHFTSELIASEVGEPEGIGVVKLLEGGPTPGLFTPIFEYWRAFAA